MEKMTVKQYLATNRRPASKYGNIHTEYKGQTFMSKKEVQYAMTLDSLKKAKNASERVVSYETQVSYKIVLNDIKICRYITDFIVKYADGHIEIIDVKGVRTQIYRLKKRLVEAQYGIKIIEV